ncbi:MAG TPA: RidA family protein [Bdellovibrionales bacterium]|nr:RidA family protein [Bdellovibrionales bacterium]
MKFERVYSASPWEAKVGYCRAVRAGNLIFVTGSAPIGDDGKLFAPGRPYEQARRCIEIIETAIKGLGGELSNVVRTRMFVTDVSLWAEFGRAHREFFEKHPPATSMVQVAALIEPGMLIEIEADAVL